MRRELNLRDCSSLLRIARPRLPQLTWRESCRAWRYNRRERQGSRASAENEALSARQIDERIDEALHWFQGADGKPIRVHRWPLG